MEGGRLIPTPIFMEMIMATYVIKGKTAALDITITTDDDGNIKMMQGYGDSRDTVWITKEQRDEIEQLFTPTQWNFNVAGKTNITPLSWNNAIREWRIYVGKN